MPVTIPLNFPSFPFRIREAGEREEIFDPSRRKYVVLTPEEWVRQHLLMVLHQQCSVPLSLLAVEKRLKVLNQNRRFDIAVFSRVGRPVLLAECKAPHIPLNQDVMDQAGRYNLSLHVPWLCVTNGITHYICKREENSWIFKNTFPSFDELCVGGLDYD